MVPYRSWWKTICRWFSNHDQAANDPCGRMAERIQTASDLAQRREWAAAEAVYSEVLDQMELAPVLLGRAYARMQCSNRTGALRDLNRLIEVLPEFVDPHILRAQILAELEAWDECLVEWEIVVALEGDEVAYRNQAALAAIRSGRLDAARTHLDAALRLDDQNAWAYGMRGFVGMNDASEAAVAPGVVRDMERSLELVPEQPELHVRLAELALRDEAPARALTHCDAALAMAPGMSAAQGLRGIAHEIMDNHEAAMEDCSQAIANGCTLPAVRWHRALAAMALQAAEVAVEDVDWLLSEFGETADCLALKVQIHFSRGEPEEVVAVADRLLEIEPERTDAYIHRGNARRMLNQISEAILDFTSALRVDADQWPARANRGGCLAELGRLEDAVQDYRVAVEQAAEIPALRCEYADTLRALGRHDEAMAQIDAARQLDPDSTDLLVLRARTCFAAERWSDAISDYTLAIAGAEDPAMALYERSAAYLACGQLEAAEKDLQTVTELHPEAAEALRVGWYANEIRRLIGKDEIQEALAMCGQFQFDCAAHPSAFWLRATAHWYAGEHVEALEQINLCLELCPDESRSPRLTRGKIYAEMGEWQLALQDLDEVLEELEQSEADPGQVASCLQSRALALAGMNRTAESDRDFAKALRLAPHNAWTYFHQGMTLAERGQTENARRCFERALKESCPALPPRKQRQARAFLSKPANSVARARGVSFVLTPDRK